MRAVVDIKDKNAPLPKRHGSFNIFNTAPNNNYDSTKIFAISIDRLSLQNVDDLAVRKLHIST